MARRLMAGDQRQVGQRRPVAFDGMEVAVADAAGPDLDQDFAVAGLRNGDSLLWRACP